MKVEVRPLNRDGRPLEASLRKTLPPVRGKLKLYEDRLRVVGRWVRCATVISDTDGLETPQLPALLDAEVVYAMDNKMRIIGTEEVRGAHVAQTWDVRVL